MSADQSKERSPRAGGPSHATKHKKPTMPPWALLWWQLAATTIARPPDILPGDLSFGSTGFQCFSFAVFVKTWYSVFRPISSPIVGKKPHGRCTFQNSLGCQSAGATCPLKASRRTLTQNSGSASARLVFASAFGPPSRLATKAPRHRPPNPPLRRGDDPPTPLSRGAYAEPQAPSFDVPFLSTPSIGITPVSGQFYTNSKKKIFFFDKTPNTKNLAICARGCRRPSCSRQFPDSQTFLAGAQRGPRKPSPGAKTRPFSASPPSSPRLANHRGPERNARRSWLAPYFSPQPSQTTGLVRTSLRS